MTNGQRLARLRLRKGWTQRRLADESGYTVATIKAWEQGRRSLDSVSVIVHLAQVLGAHATEITGQPFVPASPEQDAGHTAVGAIKLELLAYNRPPRISAAEADQITLADLRRRTTQVSRLRQAARYSKLGAQVPPLLRDLRIAAHTCCPSPTCPPCTGYGATRWRPPRSCCTSSATPPRPASRWSGCCGPPSVLATRCASPQPSGTTPASSCALAPTTTP
ncbi:hypothetical protein TH66_14215 [Carbonactinospora thermoautotrophica]|uniref:HTH cro/C1-type domain-containing protein n=1 Tax=Carbonactinospora thermoautotrophica TaxID=1469144 RepID=A0A132NGB8_9ACTN|nr:hypothetical protein TH66_14215 [Carbonactinospora thermoautotrophica]KWX09130.1 hypothetical protein TR74_11455 [Carbonactinospora thermoautotrophica]